MIRRFATMSSRVLQKPMLAAALVCAAPPLAHAQQASPGDDRGEPASSTAYPVVQPLGPSPTRALNDALSRLARDPRDMAALVDAGSAALDLGDTDAAIGFFTRAEQVAPGNGQVRARIGSAMLRSNQPFEAIRWFDLADQAGADRAAMATDRGLAYDLIGDNAAAQRQYQLALSGRQNDEASRRYAVSLVIAGDRRGAELVVQPLLERRDRGAWRVRTFIMAISGQSDEAEGIARATMPADLAAAISPYLRYMPRLTPAQQAAAANLGRFPRAADIGRDDAQILQYAALHPRAPRVDAGLIPAGAALGGKGRDDRDSRAKRRRPGRDAGRDAGRDTGRDTVVAVASPAAQPAPPAVSAPWGLPPGGTAQVRTQIAAATAQTAVATPQPVPLPQSTPQPAAPRAAAAPVVLSRLDVPPGTPLSPPPLPRPAPTAPVVAARPVPALTVATSPAPATVLAPAPAPAPAPAANAPVPVPAPTLPVTPPVTAAVTPAVTPPPPASRLAPPPERLPVPAQAATVPPVPIVPVPIVPAPAVAAPVLALASAPAPAAVPTPAPTSTTTPTPALAPSLTPAPAPQVSPPPAQPAPVPADFRSMFAGYQPPEQEAAPAAAAVDLARIEVLRGAAAKSGRAKAKDRGERPDGPTAVSRISDEDAATVTAKAAKDKSAKDKPETTKSAKDKAALDKACLDLANAAKAGKSAKGKPVKGKSITKAGTKAGTDPVCPADSDRDKKGKAAKAQPSHASRIWVQVLTGANRDVMDREWQRLVREASALRGRKPSITPWRSNFRLLTGPFDSEAEAQAFLDRLRKDGVSGFQWTSPAGQVVDSLQLK